jgi:hypothetical protein
MLLTLQIVAVFLVGVAMSMALAHALEYPGKLRLDERTYVAVQAIYYPGFTIGGIGELFAVVATLVLALVMRDRGTAFWWALGAFIAVAVMHAIFWTVTQPTNKYWLKEQQLSKAGARFFGVDRENRGDPTKSNSLEWMRLRDRWEYSHIARAILSVFALVALAIAIAR